MKVIEKGMFYGAKAELFDLALMMRRKPTDAENIMWEILRRFRKSGYIFRRQHPIKFYIADFYCHKLRLVIEVDGEIHSKQEIKTHDEGRSGEHPEIFPLPHRGRGMQGGEVFDYTNLPVFHPIQGF